MRHTFICIFILSGFVQMAFSRNYVERLPRILLVYQPTTNDFSFQYAQCTPKASDGTAVTGACVNYVSCILQGGSIQGKCFFGLKACCVFSTSTTTPPPGVVTETIENDYPPQSKTYEIQQISSSYCQVRLDFINFMLEEPNGEGVCDNGVMTVSPPSNNMPEICGANTGQHVYLEFADSSSFVLSIRTTSTSARWTIQATQLLCTDPQIAPANCLQYFNSSSGTVQSFNFPILSIPSQDITSQLANTDYEICVGEANQYCGATWSGNTDINNFYFTISSDVTLHPIGDIGDERIAQYGASCTTDYVIIENGQFTTAGAPASANQFCGAAFPSQVQSRSTRIAVFTDGAETTNTASPDQGNAGFSLSYELISC